MTDLILGFIIGVLAIRLYDKNKEKSNRPYGMMGMNPMGMPMSPMSSMSPTLTPFTKSESKYYSCLDDNDIFNKPAKKTNDKPIKKKDLKVYDVHKEGYNESDDAISKEFQTETYVEGFEDPVGSEEFSEAYRKRVSKLSELSIEDRMYQLGNRDKLEKSIKTYGTLPPVFDRIIRKYVQDDFIKSNTKEYVMNVLNILVDDINYMLDNAIYNKLEEYDLRNCLTKAEKILETIK